MSGNKAKISVRVQPNATRSEVAFINGVLLVKVAAPPVKGKANKALITLLSQVLGVNKGALAIIKGHASRNKVITIDGLEPGEAMKRLSSFSGGATSRVPRQ